MKLRVYPNWCIRLGRALFVTLVIGLVSLPAQAIEVGDQFHLKSVELLDGRVVDDKTWRQRLTVVQVWATWCPYCRAQNKVLQQLYEKVKPSRLNYLTISVDKNKTVVEKYLQDHQYTFPVAMMSPNLKEAIGKRKGVPELYVLDRKGNVLFKAYGQLFDEDIFELERFALPLP